MMLVNALLVANLVVSGYLAYKLYEVKDDIGVLYMGMAQLMVKTGLAQEALDK